MLRGSILNRSLQWSEAYIQHLLTSSSLPVCLILLHELRAHGLPEQGRVTPGKGGIKTSLTSLRQSGVPVLVKDINKITTYYESHAADGASHAIILATYFFLQYKRLPPFRHRSHVFALITAPSQIHKVRRQQTNKKSTLQGHKRA